MSEKKEYIVLYEDEFKRLDNKFKIKIEYDENIDKIFGTIFSYDYDNDIFYPLVSDCYSAKCGYIGEEYKDSKVWFTYKALSNIK